MAYIKDSQGRITHLAPHHTFGRLRYSVDTLIEHAEISRYHAVIEWINDVWMIKDLSTNGVWVNGTKIPKNQYQELKAGDNFSFGLPNANRFVLADIHPPEDMLYLFDEESSELSEKVIYLQNYNMLPNSECPKVVLYKEQDTWLFENLKGNDVQERQVKDRDLISIEGVRWQLRLSQLDVQTFQLEESLTPLEHLLAEFQVSQDEENVILKVWRDGEIIDLKSRNFHYLSLYLARQRYQDVLKGVTNSEQGWVYRDDAAKALGMDDMNLNLHLHRAKKHFVKAFESVNNASNFIECRPSQLRFGSLPCRVRKADSIEFDTSTPNATNVV